MQDTGHRAGHRTQSEDTGPRAGHRAGHRTQDTGKSAGHRTQGTGLGKAGDAVALNQRMQGSKDVNDSNLEHSRPWSEMKREFPARQSLLFNPYMVV